MAANNVLSQADIDALLAGATPSLEAPSDLGPSAAQPEPEPEASSGASSEEFDALSEKVASLEGALERLGQLDVLAARVLRLEETVVSMRQSNAANLQKLQMQMVQRLNAIVEMVKASRSASQAQAQQARPGMRPQRQPGRPAQPGQPQRRTVRR